MGHIGAEQFISVGVGDLFVGERRCISSCDTCRCFGSVIYRDGGYPSRRLYTALVQPQNQSKHDQTCRAKFAIVGQKKWEIGSRSCKNEISSNSVDQVGRHAAVVKVNGHIRNPSKSEDNGNYEEKFKDPFDKLTFFTRSCD